MVIAISDDSVRYYWCHRFQLYIFSRFMKEASPLIKLHLQH